MRRSVAIAATAFATALLPWASASHGAPATKRGIAPPALPAPSVALSLGFKNPKRWTLRLENTGAVPVRIIADPALLSFEIVPPPSAEPAPVVATRAKAKPRATKPPPPLRCALPSDMRPSNDARGVVLLPGKAYTDTFDPRLYCFGAREAAALSVGSRLLGRYGFASTSKVAAPPFAVAPIPEADGTTSHAPLKEIHAEPIDVTEDALALPLPRKSPDAQRDDARAPGSPPSDALAARFALATPERLDGAQAATTTIAVTLTNTGLRAGAVYFRPQTLGFDVFGPDGATHCPAVGTRAVRELFTSLGPKGKTQLSLLVGPSCPPGTFDVPGIYEMRARLDTRGVTGSPETLHAFEGEAIADGLTLLRVRQGAPHAPKPPPKIE